jgi:hypothetical protein
MFMEPRNLFQGMNSASLRSLAGPYDNPIPPRFLAPIDLLKNSSSVYSKQVMLYRCPRTCITYIYTVVW